MEVLLLNLQNKMAKKIRWKEGDVFTIPLLNKNFSVGHVLDLQMPNIVRIALYDEIIDIKKYDITKLCNYDKLISLIATSREQLDFGVWKIIGFREQQIPVSKFPNERFRNNGWIGAIHYDAAVAEDFINSFYALLPWDDWGNPDFLDKLLYDSNKKPTNLIYLKK